MLSSNCIYFIYHSKHIRKYKISSFHCGVVEAFTLLGWCICTRNWWHYSTGVKRWRCAMTWKARILFFWTIMVCHWVFNSNLLQELCSFKTSAIYYPQTQHYGSGEQNPQPHQRENLRIYANLKLLNFFICSYWKCMLEKTLKYKKKLNYHAEATIMNLLIVIMNFSSRIVKSTWLKSKEDGIGSWIKQLTVI